MGEVVQFVPKKRSLREIGTSIINSWGPDPDPTKILVDPALPGMVNGFCPIAVAVMHGHEE